MKKLIIVEVSVKTMNPKEPFKKVFSRQIEVSDDLCFPYELIVKSLSFLFGVGSVVTISTHNSK